MNTTAILRTKRSLIVVAALITGFLMPYLSRIPLAFVYGPPWIWKYMTTFDDFLHWNGLHFFSLVFVIFFGAVYVLTDFRWAFFAAVFGQLAVTGLIYYNFEEHYHPDDFLGFFLHPIIIAFISFVSGIVAFLTEVFLITWKGPNPELKFQTHSAAE